MSTDDLRPFLLWFGALLLDEGHVVQVPEGRSVLVVRTKAGPRVVHVSVRPKAIVPEGRVIVGTVSEIEDANPDAVAIVGRDDHELEKVYIVPVQSTKPNWITEGRHYMIDAESLVTIDRLHALLAKLGRA